MSEPRNFMATLRPSRRDRLGRDPYKRLAAAVIFQAVKDFEKSPRGLPLEEQSETRISARKFLQSDMAPWADIIGLDPSVDRSFRRWCAQEGLVPESYRVTRKGIVPEET